MATLHGHNIIGDQTYRGYGKIVISGQSNNASIKIIQHNLVNRGLLWKCFFVY